jgi:hypothetical protein
MDKGEIIFGFAAWKSKLTRNKMLRGFVALVGYFD